MNIPEEILKKIDELEDDMIRWARDLVSFPSVSGREKGGQEYVARQFEELGFDDVDLWEPDIDELRGHPAFVSPREDFIGSPNVVGRLAGTGGGRSLILNSHIDVVPVGDVEQWRHGPFDGEVDQGRIFGRGISDMKGTKAAMFTALKALIELGIRPQGDILIESVIEEESGSSGTLACVLRGYRADAAIIPEPSGFAICPAQQGSTWFRVRVPGISAHGGQRYMGVSAIENFMQVFPRVQAFEEEVNRKYASELYAGVPIPFTVNVGVVRGGDWPSTVPEEVAFEGRMGVPPGLTLEEARAMFQDRVIRPAYKAWLGQHPPKVEWLGASWGSAQIQVDHPIVECAKNAYRSVAREEPRLAGTPWATDGRILIEYADTPALIFGPGTSAHCPDEFMPIEDLHRYAKMLAAAIVDWCGAG